MFGYHRPQMTRRPIALLVVVLLLSCGAPATTSTTGGTAADALSRGLQAHSAGKLDEATAAYFETLAKDPKNKFAFYNLGVIAQSAQGQTRAAAAESYYRLALEQDPAMTSALFNLAILRGNAGANQEAADLYRRVIAVEPNYAAAHYNLAFALRALGQNAEALQEFATAQRLDPKLVAPTPSASPARQASPSPTR
jgi:tetratricopeptide (TPR) repeat protein